MAHKHFNEEELAAYLDQHLPSGSGENTIPDGETDPLIEAVQRLDNAPKPQLSQAARDRIRAQMLDAMPVAPPTSQARTVRFPVAMLAVAAAVAAFVIGVGLFTRIPDNGADNIAMLSTETATEAPTNTAASTVTSAMSSTGEVIVIATVEATDQPTETSPTDAPTDTPTSTNTLEPTPFPTVTPQTTALIIEGEIETVEGNRISVYGFAIEIDEDDELLSFIDVGDFIRIEGEIETVNGTPVVIATMFDLYIESDEITADTGSESGDVIVNNEEGEVWRDTGNCDNPPPDWAPANGWRARCEGSSNGNRGNGRGNGN